MKTFCHAIWVQTRYRPTQVYDGVKKIECDIHNVPVSKEMLQACRSSQMKYSLYLEDQKKEKKVAEEEDRMKILKHKVQECRKTEMQLESEAEQLLEKKHTIAIMKLKKT